jgi:hypothetical protein
MHKSERQGLLTREFDAAQPFKVLVRPEVFSIDSD